MTIQSLVRKRVSLVLQYLAGNWRTQLSKDFLDSINDLLYIVHLNLHCIWLQGFCVIFDIEYRVPGTNQYSLLALASLKNVSTYDTEGTHFFLLASLCSFV